MKRQTVALLPFAPHQQPNSPPWSPQRSVANSRLPSLFDTSVPWIMPGTTAKQAFVSRRPNPLRIRPSIISESSCDTSTSSSSSSSSSSFPNISSPTSLSTPPTSLPPSPSPPPPPPPYVLSPSLQSRQSDCRACGCDALIAIASHARLFLISPYNHSPGKSRPLPQPPAPIERPFVPYDPVDAGQSRPRSPPPAWSPPLTPSTNVRPTLPDLIMPVAPPRRETSGSPDVRVTPNSPRTHTVLDGSVSSPGQLRVRPLPMRPVPPGPPSEDNTPIATYSAPHWHTDALTIPQDEISSPFDDRGEIDWDLIDEVMKNAG